LAPADVGSNSSEMLKYIEADMTCDSAPVQKTQKTDFISSA
jgi:hypothetical protein